MAKTGLRYIVVAKLISAEDGQKPVCEKGMVLGAGVEANITYTINEAKLYANNALKESSKAITGGTINLTLDDLINEARAYAMNVKKIEDPEDPEHPIWRTIGKDSPYVGVGYIEERIIDGVTTHLPTWVYKCQFAPGDKTAQTRGENVEFRTTQIAGEMMGVYPDDSGDVAFIDDKEYADGASAMAWIKKMANITEG